MKNITLILLAIAAMVGCKVNEEKDKDSVVKNYIGFEYELVSVEYRDGTTGYVPHELYSFIIADTDLITGKDVCYNYNVKSEWTQDNFLMLTDYGQSFDPSCKKSDIHPLALQERMKFTFTPSKIYLYSDIATSEWKKATFTRTNY